MLRLLGGLLMVALVAFPASGQYPSKPVHIIVQFPPGGPADTVMRIVSQPLSQALGQPVVIENRPGADGAIAAGLLLKSPADGHTLLFAGSTALIGVPIQRKNPPYDPLKDFAPISRLGQFTLYLFSSTRVPVKTLAELVDYARANPGKVNYGTGNFGAVLMAAQLAKATGLSMVHVPYKGEAPLVPDLIAGNLQFAFLAGFSGLPHAKEGRLRVLAAVHSQRTPFAPDVPTMTEAGVPEVSVLVWTALFGPAKMPREIVDRLSREVNAVLARIETREQLSRLSFTAEGSSPEALSALLEEQLDLSIRAARDAGIQPE
jgi:tripartite-type tricarboxylate transporter receptor subunit TctC